MQPQNQNPFGQGGPGQFPQQPVQPWQPPQSMAQLTAAPQMVSAPAETSVAMPQQPTPTPLPPSPLFPGTSATTASPIPAAPATLPPQFQPFPEQPMPQAQSLQNQTQQSMPPSSQPQPAVPGWQPPQHDLQPNQWFQPTVTPQDLQQAKQQIPAAYQPPWRPKFPGPNAAGQHANYAVPQPGQPTQAQQFAPPGKQGQQPRFTPAPTPKRNRLKIALFAVLVAIIIGGGAFLYTVFLGKPSPDAVFNDMLAASVATQQVRQTTKQTGGLLTAQIDYDVANPKQPKVVSSVQLLGNDGSVSRMKYYSTFQDTFVEFISNSTDPKIKAYANKWAQARVNGTLQPNSNSTLAPEFEARQVFFGQMPFGNFSKSDQQTLKQALQDGVFTYNAKLVTTEKLNGKDVLVYKVKINTNKLVAYNQKVANMVGQGIDDAKDGLMALTSATLYVDPSSKHLLQVKSNGVTITYSNYNDLTFAGQPSSQIEWNTFIAAMGGNSVSVSNIQTSQATDTSSSTQAGSTTGTSTAATSTGPSDASQSFDDPNFDDPLWSGDAGEAPAAQ